MATITVVQSLAGGEAVSFCWSRGSSAAAIIRYMARPTSGEIDHRDSAALKKFLHKLAEIQSSADVKSLLADCPSPSAASYRFYSNLAFFIEHFVPPRTADISETQHYIRLAERLRARGEASGDARAQAVAKFKASEAARR